MDNRDLALRAANIADRFTYRISERKIDGRDMIVIPHDEAMEMKNDLLSISHRLNDIQDSYDKAE